MARKEITMLTMLGVTTAQSGCTQFAPTSGEGIGSDDAKPRCGIFWDTTMPEILLVRGFDRIDQAMHVLRLVVLACLFALRPCWGSQQPAMPNLDPTQLQEFQKQMEQIQKDMQKEMEKLTKRGFKPDGPPRWLDGQAWSLVTKGMTTEQVTEALGEPANTTPTGGFVGWLYGYAPAKNSIGAGDAAGQVLFKDGKVERSLVDASRLNGARKRWERDHPGETEATAPKKLAAPKSAGEGLPNCLEPANWESIDGGMTERQVVEFLGEPTRKDVSPGSAIWHYMPSNPSIQYQYAQPFGQVNFFGGKAVGATLLDPAALAAERTFLTASRQTAVEEVGLPRWCAASRWNKIRVGMSAAAVIDILGLPSWGQREHELRYTDWQRDGVEGIVTLADGKVQRTTPPSPGKVKALSEAAAAVVSANCPQWMNPAAWATITLGLDEASVEKLLGKRELKKPGIGDTVLDQTKNTFKRVETVAWVYGDSFAAGKAVGSVEFADPDFPEVYRVYAPNFEEISRGLRDRGGVAADIPAWSDPQAWRRLAGFSVFHGESARSKSMKDMLKVDPDISWKPSEEPCAGVWRGEWRFGEGSLSGLSTWPVSGPKPPDDTHLFIDAVKMPPALLRPVKFGAKEVASGRAKEQARQMDAWWHIAAMFEPPPGDEYSQQQSTVGTGTLLAMLGQPDRVEWQEASVVQGFEPPPIVAGQPYEPRARRRKIELCIFHYGDGRLVLLGQLDRQVKQELNDRVPSNVQVSILRIVPPSTDSMVRAAKGQTWPEFGSSTHVLDTQGRPHFLDLTRWARIQQGDSVPWVIHVLGQPENIEQTDRGTVFKYAGRIFAGEKWRSGSVLIGTTVIAIEPPSKKE